ncbi:hypothetical protein ACFLS1_06455 [Verrucomicrobiota bacterium]
MMKKLMFIAVSFLLVLPIVNGTEFTFKNNKTSATYGPIEIRDGAWVKIGFRTYALKMTNKTESEINLEEKLRGIIMPGIDFRNEDIRNVMKKLEEHLLAHDPEKKGANIICTLRGIMPKVTLSMKNISVYDAISYIAEICNYKFRIDARSVVISNIPDDKDSIRLVEPKTGKTFGPIMPNNGASFKIEKDTYTILMESKSKRQTEIEKQLRDLIIPEINFAGKDIREVIYFFQKFYQKNVPGKKWINIIHTIRDHMPAVTLSVRNISMYEGMQYVTEICNLKFRIDDNAIVISETVKKRSKR